MEPLTPSHKELDLLSLASVKTYLKKNNVSKIIHAAGFVGGIGLHVDHPGHRTILAGSGAVIERSLPSIAPLPSSMLKLVAAAPTGISGSP